MPIFEGAAASEPGRRARTVSKAVVMSWRRARAKSRVSEGGAYWKKWPKRTVGRQEMERMRSRAWAEMGRFVALARMERYLGRSAAKISGRRDVAAARYWPPNLKCESEKVVFAGKRWG